MTYRLPFIHFLFALLASAIMALCLTAHAYAGAADVSGRVDGYMGGGITSGATGGAGNGMVKTYDVLNLGGYPNWPTAPRLWSSPILCKGMEASIFNLKTGGYRVGPNADAARTNCARKVTAAAAGGGVQGKVPLRWLNGICSSSKTAKASPSPCYRNTAVKLTPLKSTDQAEIHRPGPATALPAFQAGSSTAWAVRIYKWNSATGKYSKMPVFTRSIGNLGKTSVDAPLINVPSDNGMLNCKQAPPVIAIDGCMNGDEWYMGGDGPTTKGALPVGFAKQYAWAGTSMAGPLPADMGSGATGAANLKSCARDWSSARLDLMQLSKLDVAKGLKHQLMSTYVAEGTTLDDYVLAGAPTGSLQFSCMWTTSKPFFRGAVNPNTGIILLDKKTKKPVGDTLAESVALGWSIPTCAGCVPRIYYRVQGAPKHMYMVQVVSLGSREEIVKQQLDGFFAPGPIGTCDACPASAGPPCDIAQGDICTTPNTNGDSAEGSVVLRGLSVDGEQVSSFPTAEALITGPESVGTGEPASFTVSGQVSEQIIDEGQAIWPIATSLQMSDPRVGSSPLWAFDLGNKPYNQTAFRAALDERSTPATTQIAVGWPLAGSANGMPFLWSYMHTPAAQPATPPEGVSLGALTARASWLKPSVNDQDPVLAQGMLEYESGRFYDNLADPRLGVRTDKLRAQDSYALPTDLTIPQTAMHAYLLRPDDCDRSPTGICATINITSTAASNVVVTSRETRGVVYTHDCAAGRCTFTLPTSLPEGGYTISTIYNTAALRGLNNPSWGISASVYGDLNDGWEWANQNAGPDKDPRFDIARPAGELPLCGVDGICQAWTDYQRTMILGNQPSQ